MTDRQEAFEELAKKYEAITGVRIRFELYSPPGAYSQKIRASAQGRTLPDIFGILGEKRDFASFIKAGHILDLTPYMEENNSSWKNSFFKEALRVNIFGKDNPFGVKPGIYGVPIDVMNIQVIYNKSLLKKAGLGPQPPQTWKQFIDYALTVRNKLGVQGFASGWSEVWLIYCFLTDYAFNIMGEDKFFATLKGEIPYTDEDWLRVLSLFKELRDKGIVTSGIITMQNKEAERLFSNEKAVFSFNGSWCVNVYKGMNPQLDYGVCLPPLFSSKYPMRIWGGAGSSFMVNAGSPKREEAVKFLRWLTQKEQQAFLARKTNNLPSNKECIGAIPEVLSEFADDMESTTHPNIWPAQEFPKVVETLTKGVQYIITGEKTPQEVAQEVQKVKEEEIRRNK